MMGTGTDWRPGNPAEALVRRVSTLAHTVIRRCTEWASDRRYAEEHARVLQELERTGDLEVLVELTGATREQLLAAELTPLAAMDLLNRMMQRLGLDAQQEITQVDAMSDAQWRCRCCKEWRQCRHWLDAGVPDDGYRRFCNNAELFERMRSTRTCPRSVAAAGRLPARPGVTDPRHSACKRTGS